MPKQNSKIYSEKEKYKIDAVLGSIIMSVKDIKNIEKGTVIDLGIPAGEKAKCYHNNKFLFNGEIMVFEKNLAVRINNEKKILKELPKLEKIQIDIENKNITDNLNYTQNIKNNNQNNSKMMIGTSLNNKMNMNFNYLKDIKNEELSEFIITEHPQTIALILSHLDIDKSAKILSMFPDDLRCEVIMRLSKIGNISPEIIKEVSDILFDKIKELSNFKVELGGVKLAAEILKKMEDKESKSILTQISQLDQELSETIEENKNEKQNIK